MTATLKVRITRPCMLAGQHTPLGAIVTVDADTAQTLVDCLKGQLVDPADAAAARDGRREQVLKVLSRERSLAQQPTDGPWMRWQG